MDYEKAYTNAVALAKQAIKDCGHNEGRKRMIEDIFPELTDPDRIRQELIQYLKDYPNLPNGRYCRDDFFAWLEKQGVKSDYNPYKATIESISAMVEKYASGDLGDFYDNVKVKCKDAMEYDKIWNEKQGEHKLTPKFKVEDWIVNNDANVYQVKEIDYTNIIPRYELENIDGDKLSIPFTSDYNLKNWTIQDAKDGDVLASMNGCPFIYKKSDGVEARFYCCIDFENYFCVDDGTSHCGFKDSSKPATKEQRDRLFSKMREAGYEWDDNKKELKKIEQNSTDSYCKEYCKGFQETGKCFADGKCKAKRQVEQNTAWSEEDELRFKQAIYVCHRNGYTDVESWLKSLKPQPQWKPTAEQMQSLYFAIITYSKKDDCKLTYDSLNSLYDNLKTLSYGIEH